jgi:hypothetical protein
MTMCGGFGSFGLCHLTPFGAGSEAGRRAPAHFPQMAIFFEATRVDSIGVFLPCSLIPGFAPSLEASAMLFLQHNAISC